MKLSYTFRRDSGLKKMPCSPVVSVVIVVLIVVLLRHRVAKGHVFFSGLLIAVEGLYTSPQHFFRVN